MDQPAAQVYQFAASVVTKASLFLNLFRPFAGGDDPAGNLSLVTSAPGTTIKAELIRQLNGPDPVPSLIGLTMSAGLFEVLTRDAGSFQNFVGNIAALPFKIIKDVITGNALHELQQLPGELETALSRLGAPLFQLPFLLINQLEVALSVLPTVQMLSQSRQALANIDRALAEYFFTEGFATVDGERISRPDLSDVQNGDIKTIKSLVSQKSGTEFVRNAVRLPIEAGADVEYSLKGRMVAANVVAFGNNPTDAQKHKLLAWMKGFAAQAEAATTTAVEGLILGAGSVQTNPLIAAAAGTAAGTMAKKATQHVFLRELGV